MEEFSFLFFFQFPVGEFCGMAWHVAICIKNENTTCYLWFRRERLTLKDGKIIKTTNKRDVSYIQKFVDDRI